MDHIILVTAFYLLLIPIVMIAATPVILFLAIKGQGRYWTKVWGYYCRMFDILLVTCLKGGAMS